MYLERLLQINMATLAALGALLLGMGERSVGPPLLVALAAAASVWLTDISGWFRLGRRVADALMLLAAVISLGQAFPITNELQALDLAWFMVYLQVILLFRVKDQQTYWLLVMLSLLQVVVATLFNQGIWFGMLLAVYMLLGFSAMTLLLLYRQWHRPRRGAEGDFVCLPGGESHAGLGRELFGRLGRMALHTLILTIVLFFVVPRLGQTTWCGAVGNPRTLVGYSDTVKLGELGEVIENRDDVMRVRFFDRAHNDPRPIHGEIYLQGAILMTYDKGHWQAGLPSWNMRTELLERPEQLPRSDLVWQEITVEGLDHDELFFVAPFVALQSTIDISFDHARQRLLRSEQVRGRQFRYRLGTTAIVGGVQKPLTPRDRLDSTKRALQLPEGARTKSLRNLVQLARQWIDESHLPKEDHVGRARYLERQFAASGKFQYSLTGQERDLTIDPIEDFVSQHRQGHCEYFATALALMLRSQDIPARVIVGYKCDDWNEAGGYYQVRQLHAHTWVEAYLPPDQIPANSLHGKDYWRWKQRGYGAWLRLDPTPAGAGPEKTASWSAPLRGTMDWLDSAWSNYVMELDYQRQRDMIYEPIGQALRTAWQKATDPELWRAVRDAAVAMLHLDQLGGVAGWLAAAAALVAALLILAGAAWLAGRMGRSLWARWAGNHAGHTCSRRAEIEFYRRFETLLARQGLFRATGQTQREFAVAAGLRLARQSGEPHWTGLPLVVADAFYRVRFGRQPLDNPDSQAVEHVLGELTKLERPPLIDSRKNNSVRE